MIIEIIEETSEILPEYEKVSIAFRVETFFRVELVETGLGGVKLIEEKIEKPFIKDYDAIEGNKISSIGEQFDLSNWGILSAFENEKCIGGAIIAWNTPQVLMLENRIDLACLWDLRVVPEWRKKGIGKMLFDRAIVWASERNCSLLKIETQNINVPACRFYARQGCELGAINRFAYPESLKETQLIWYRKI